MDEYHEIRPIDLSASFTEEVLERARRYVQQRAAVLAWHRLYNWPFLRHVRPRRVGVGLDGFDVDQL